MLLSNKTHVTIIGAGLCGALLALRLGQRGYHVSVYEKRPDLRKKPLESGRSINLALSDRGIKALRLVGLEEQAKALCVPMYGRMIHTKKGETFLSNYSGRSHEYINAISRNDLNALLLNACNTYENISLHFYTKCTDVDFENTIASFQHYDTKKTFTCHSDIILATDGAGSILRKNYYLKKHFLFSFSQQYLTHGYKELHIPAMKDGSYKIDKQALHIWPRGDFMLIALPNNDGSFVVTLFLSYSHGTYNFDILKTSDQVLDFFATEFPDTLELIPNITHDFFKNPTSPLGTVTCSPWHYKAIHFF